MKHQVVEKNYKRYVECIPDEELFSNEEDALNLVSACLENSTQHLLIHSDVFSDDFFKLGTGLAGTVLQKFANYHIKAAIVMSDDEKIEGRFKEMVDESNQGNALRTFNQIPEAESWLLNL